MLGIKVLNNTCFVCVFAIYSNARCDSTWINLFRRLDLKSWLRESICKKYWFSTAICSLQMDKRWRLNLRNAAVVLLSCGAVNRCGVRCSVSAAESIHAFGHKCCCCWGCRMVYQLASVLGRDQTDLVISLYFWQKKNRLSIFGLDLFLTPATGQLL